MLSLGAPPASGGLPPDLVRQFETIDRLALADMLVEDGGDISFGHVLVPHAVWVDDHGGSQLAGTQAVRWGHDDLAEQIALHHPDVELVEVDPSALLSARTLWIARRT